MKEKAPRIPMISNAELTRAGLFPVRGREVRFAVGDPNGLTSNSWKVKAKKKGDIYIICRDNFKEAKVSLHPRGGWRMAFTTEAIKKNPKLMVEKNRDWAVWDEPLTTLPNTIVAFHLYFPTSELSVSPQHRKSDDWKGTIYIEAGPPGKLTTVTLFITVGEPKPTHESEPSFVLASFDIGEGRFAQLIAHGDPEGTIPEMIEHAVVAVRKQATSSKVTIPAGAYAYFFGHRKNGARFLVGARMNRGPLP